MTKEAQQIKNLNNIWHNYCG